MSNSINLKYILTTTQPEIGYGLASFDLECNFDLDVDKKYMVNLPSNFLEILCAKLKLQQPCYYIVYGKVVQKNVYGTIARCLIDADYTGIPVFYISHCTPYAQDGMRFNTELVFEVFSKVSLAQCLNVGFNSAAYNWNLFDHDKENLLIDKIEAFKKGTSGANGCDIIFERDYVIRSQGILTLSLPWSKNLDFKDKSHMFLLRSKFASMGIELHIHNPNRLIILINNNPFSIDLGNRFIQIVPPQMFQFDRFNNWASHLFTNQKVSIFANTAPRQCKTEKKEHCENFIAVTANFNI